MVLARRCVHLVTCIVFWFVAVTSLWSAYGSCWSLRPTRGLGAPLVRHSNHPTTERPCIHLLFIFPTTQVSFLGLWRYLIPMVSRPMSTFNNDSTNAKTLTWTSNILIHLHNTLHTHSSLSSFLGRSKRLYFPSEQTSAISTSIWLTRNLHFWTLKRLHTHSSLSSFFGRSKRLYFHSELTSVISTLI